MSDRPFVSQFSPQRTDPEALEQILVQRHDLLAESVELIRESILTENKHHLLFIGSRGSGKTHLVTLIHHRLTQQTELGEKLRFAWLNEDETATSFLKLLILIFRDLTVRYPQEFPAADLQSIYGLDAEIARERLCEMLLRHLGSRTLVVLMENLDSLFKHMPEGEQRTWRAFVQNHPVFATVGTAQSLFSGVSDRNEPFFGFFDARHLDPLSVEDAITLLKNLAHINNRDDLFQFLDSPTGQARVHAIHDLAGGNPRLYIIFSDFLTRESLDDLVRPFEEAADRQLTSYYQERLRWLSAQQREIVQFLCHHRQPVTVKFIAQGLFTTHNSITGQLKLLREMRYVRFHPKGREVLYELAEPLMRLSLQVKETHNRKPLALIVDFLRVWYDRKDLEGRLGQHDCDSLGHAYFSAALAALDSGEPNLRHQLLSQGLEELDFDRCDDATLVKLECLVSETNHPYYWLLLCGVKMARNDMNGTLVAATGAIEQPGLPADNVACAYIARSTAFFEAKMFKEALDDCGKVIETPGLMPKYLAAALWSRGIVNNAAGNENASLQDFSRLLSISEQDSVEYAVEPRMERLTEIIVKTLFSFTTNSSQREIRIAEFLDHFSKHKRVPQLGDALVKHIPKVANSSYNYAAYDAWVESWDNACEKLTTSDSAHMEIPLRLLRTGISFLKTKDQSFLLVLPSEERKILRDVLNLPPE